MATMYPSLTNIVRSIPDLRTMCDTDIQQWFTMCNTVGDAPVVSTDHDIKPHLVKLPIIFKLKMEYCRCIRNLFANAMNDDRLQPLPCDSYEGAQWITNIRLLFDTADECALLRCWDNIESELLDNLGIALWNTNLSCIPNTTLTKGHNHCWPVLNGIPTDGHKTFLLLPPHLRNTDSCMRNTSPNQLMSLSAMLTAAKTYKTQIYVAQLFEHNHFLYFPAGWWHWTWTTSKSPFKHTACLSTYVLPTNISMLEHVLYNMDAYYKSLLNEQKQNILVDIRGPKPQNIQSILEQLKTNDIANYNSSLISTILN